MTRFSSVSVPTEENARPGISFAIERIAGCGELSDAAAKCPAGVLLAFKRGPALVRGGASDTFDQIAFA